MLQTKVGIYVLMTFDWMNSGSGLNSTCRIVHHLLTWGVFCFLFFLLFILLMATSVFVSEGTEIFTQVKGVILNKKEQVSFCWETNINICFLFCLHGNCNQNKVKNKLESCWVLFVCFFCYARNLLYMSCLALLLWVYSW